MADRPASVSATSFNDLNLPVQWIRDVKNPGVLDFDELWVHPSFAAANAVLQRKGEPQIDPWAVAQAALAYLRKPKKVIAHPLLAKDLATRTRIHFDFDLGKLPDGPVKEAMRELLKAAALADVYYNIQRDPDYLAHLQTVLQSGDVERARHFTQSGGPKCISVKDAACTSLPGVTLDPNGIWWPDDFTKEDIETLKGDTFWKDEALKRRVLTPQSCIVEAKQVEPDAFQFKGKWYRPVPFTSFADIKLVAGMMANHLEAAAKILEGQSPEFAKMLRMRAALIAGDSLFGSYEADRLWVDASHPQILASFGNVESYEALGSPDGMKSLMQGIVAYLDPSLQAFVDGFLAHIPEGDKRLWGLWEQSGEVFPVEKVPTTPPEAGVASVVMNSGAMNAPGYVAGGFNQPNYNNYETDVPAEMKQAKLVYFGPIIAARVQNQGLPVAKLAFDPATVERLERVIPDLPSTIAFVQAHEIAHSRVTPSWMKQLSELLGDHLAASVEEAKADLVGLFDLEGYAKAGLITEAQKRGAQLVHFGNMLRGLNLGAKDEHGRGTIIEFYLLKKHGVITYNASTQRYQYDQARLSEAIPIIVKECLGTILTFNKAQLEALDRKAQEEFNASPMQQRIDELQKAGLPEENLPYYRVMGDLGQF